MYPSNIEKMNVHRTVQVFSPDVTAALEAHQKDRSGTPASHSFRKVGSTIMFMKAMKKWFDLHDTKYMGVLNKSPISDMCDPRLEWLTGEFLDYLEKIRKASSASNEEFFTSETYEALRVTSFSTVAVTRFLLDGHSDFVLTRKFTSDPVEALFSQLRAMCGGNDALDARAVACAINGLTKSDMAKLQQESPQCDMEHGNSASEDTPGTSSSESAETSLPQRLQESLYVLREYPGVKSTAFYPCFKSTILINSYFNPH